jgi:hypothetical protein
MQKLRQVCRNLGRYAGTLAGMQKLRQVCRNLGRYAGTLAET